MVKRTKGRQATKDPRVVPLLALQDELGLTDYQRRFAEALAVDPERNQTKAAIAAGAPPRGAAVAASRMLRLAKVQRYFHELTATSRAEVAEQTGAAVADVAEVLKTLTMQMRMAPDDPRVKRIDTQGAAKALLAYYTEKPLVGGDMNITVNAVIDCLPDHVVTALFRAMALASGRPPVALLGSGNGV